MSPGERPNPRNIVIYETLPNELPRVAGIITGVPQTPLSHVNLRAVQDGVPNAYIKEPLEDDEIDDLVDSFVRYEVTAEGYELRAASKAEVDAHFALSRPTHVQTPERDLTVTEIAALSEIGFGDWKAFGVKAANVAELGKLGFPGGTVPGGFAIPFYFYDEFMRHTALGEETVFGKGKGADEDKFTLPAETKLIDAVGAILAHPRFQADYEIQDEMLDDLRDAIKDARSPQWMIDALTAMHAAYPQDQSLRYRSSTNNEDLPGFSGAGLYDSNTQRPDETVDDGIDKSMKQVFASLWTFRAFAEREFHRIDHLATAMGILVHPNYSDERANGVAVSFDPIRDYRDYYYLNTQLGEDLVTNPEAESEPEEVLLHRSGDFFEVLATSNQIEPGALLMSDLQMKQLGRAPDRDPRPLRRTLPGPALRNRDRVQDHRGRHPRDQAGPPLGIQRFEPAATPGNGGARHHHHVQPVALPGERDRRGVHLPGPGPAGAGRQLVGDGHGQPCFPDQLRRGIDLRQPAGLREPHRLRPGQQVRDHGGGDRRPVPHRQRGRCHHRDQPQRGGGADDQHPWPAVHLPREPDLDGVHLPGVGPPAAGHHLEAGGR